MRKLAKIVRIDSIMEHTNADSLELAMVGGWQVCTKKNEFQQGDLAVYFEIDAMLPIENPSFTFLEGRNEVLMDNIKHSRIKTMKLRGELSQGLLLPLSILKDVQLDSIGEDQDLTEALNIKKHEPPVKTYLSGQPKGSFPSFIPKTDQERVQNLSKKYQQCVDNEDVFEVTYKLDGSSMTAFINQVASEDSNEVQTGVCSRNLELKLSDDSSLFVQYFKQQDLESKLINYHKETGNLIAVQGELVGPSIQSNFEGVSSLKFFVYNVFDIDNQRYMFPKEAREATKQLGLDYVPIFSEEMTLPKSMQDVILMADGDSGLYGKYREGLVFKCVNKPLSFKVISNKYLMKEK